MKKGLLKAGVLLLLFAAALGGTAALINREKIVGTRQMEDAIRCMDMPVKWKNSICATV